MKQPHIPKTARCYLVLSSGLARSIANGQLASCSMLATSLHPGTSHLRTSRLC